MDKEFSSMSTWNVDASDPKYVSRLSAILVATIQETKDRISQIEYAFCSQLYPHILSKTKEFHKELEKSQKEAEETWRIKEKGLLDRIQNLESEKREAAESTCHLLNDEKQRLKNLEDENWRLDAEVKSVFQEKEKAVEDKKITEENLHRLESKLAENYEVLKIREDEKSELTQSLRAMEDVIQDLKKKLEGKDRELYEERVVTARLRTEVDSNVDRIVSCEKKIKVLNESCKKSRSENTYLRKKLNLTQETMVQKPDPLERREPVCKPNHVESSKPSSGEFVASVGRRRSGPEWVNTRAREKRIRGDLHDDFLDTPLEEMTNKRVDGSDEETQDLVISDGVEPVGITREEGKQGYKFNEPVRTKVEREKLKGVECKQCSKFYDAVLPGRGGDVEGDRRVRCEHDEGVSRHRYRYVPPSTPEGFWNIGFDTEM